MAGETLTGLFLEDGDDSWCFNYSTCTFRYTACRTVQPHLRYTSASAAWVLLCSIIVFFMKAGFLLVELAFARDVRDRRHVVILKHQDAFASAFGFFLIGFDAISGYSSPQNIPKSFFGLTDPMLWFFKFTFASNAATIVGGVLVKNRYKLRLPAAFLSAFFISGIIHPIIARLIWSDKCMSFSPYRFCTSMDGSNASSDACDYGCTQSLPLHQKMYVLDFAGGGAVHMLGGIAGLVISILAKIQEYRDRGKYNRPIQQQLLEKAGSIQEAEEGEEVTPRSFLEWMYPVSGGEESVSDAALGVVILWFCWFAFNCGSTESVQVGFEEEALSENQTYYPYYGIPSTIAVNMIMAAASGGTVAIAIAVWAQIRSRSDSVNANEIANGVLSALVGITAGCAFVDYWAACLIGAMSVVLYHLGCYAEYKLKLKDTAHVVPVHGVCGLWSLLAIGIFQAGGPARCNLHAAFEGLCFCHLRLPSLTQGEVMLSQLAGALMMIGISFVACSLLYGTLYLIPIRHFVWVAEKVFFLTPSCERKLHYVGGWLFTSPGDNEGKTAGALLGYDFPDNASTTDASGDDDYLGDVQIKPQALSARYGSMDLEKMAVDNGRRRSPNGSGSAGNSGRKSGSQSGGSSGSRRGDSQLEEEEGTK